MVIDAANSIYRAFFALPPMRNSQGTPTNAVLGFVNMLGKVVREEKPDALVVAFDPPGKTFRHDAYPDYKATRDAQPEDLTTQFPIIRDVIAAYRIPLLEVPKYEADDVIATLVAKYGASVEIGIVSSDKDLMQLVTDRVVLLDTMKDRRVGPAEVEARFGVPPEKLLDVRALVGDPSDNIPGVKGIGEKGAAKLIDEWGDLENLLAHAGDVKAKRAREALESQADAARTSRELATLRRDAPLELELEDLRVCEPDIEALREHFQRLEFSRLLEGLGGEGGAAKAPKASLVETEVVEDEARLGELASELAARDRIAIWAVGVEDGVMTRDIVGIALALAPDRAVYLPLGHQTLGATNLREESVIDLLRGLLTGPKARPWVAYGAKAIEGVLANRGLEIPSAVCDVEIAAFLLDPAAKRTPATLAAQFLESELEAWERVAGKGAKATTPTDLPIDAVAKWVGGHVCNVETLAPLLEERLERDALSPLFNEIEMPLTSVLARMERNGIRVDGAVLRRLSTEYEKELSRIEGQIFALAGERFTIGSPKQLQVILFEKLKLPVVKKTKTGYSTDESVLEQLSPHHELPAQILAHRRLAKLKSTYIDALPPLVNPKTGRIHPTFHQTGAATGRLSASNPNVQNIPIRSEEGIRIREAFVPEPGCVFVSADYSQVELRLLAHYSEDESLIQGFREGADIHRRTAAEVAGIAEDEVTADQRARAKAINFGIIYGSSAFGIANQLGIATGDAQETIDAYFAQYPGVRRFLDETIARAREEGCVRTLLGRRRFLPDLGSRNRVLRNAAERMAVNSVLQGTSADLIKQAMVAIDGELHGGSSAARILLQVHDELVFEVPEGDCEALCRLARAQMESVFELRVPLLVDVGVGASWREAH